MKQCMHIEVTRHLCGDSRCDNNNALWCAVLALKTLLVLVSISCGGGLEYLHRSSARRKRRQKGTQCPGGITGLSCS
jgi:hypothetical protein